MHLSQGSYFTVLLGEGLVPNLDITYILLESRFNSSSWTLIDGGLYKVRQACDCPVEVQIDLSHSDWNFSFGEDTNWDEDKNSEYFTRKNTDHSGIAEITFSTQPHPNLGNMRLFGISPNCNAQNQCVFLCCGDKTDWKLTGNARCVFTWGYPLLRLRERESTRIEIVRPS